MSDQPYSVLLVGAMVRRPLVGTLDVKRRWRLRQSWIEIKQGKQRLLFMPTDIFPADVIASLPNPILQAVESVRKSPRNLVNL